MTVKVSSFGHCMKSQLGHELVKLEGNKFDTSVPMVGCAPEWADSGGGPPYFLWPVVTSSV